MDVIYPQNNNVGKLIDIRSHLHGEKYGLVCQGLAVLREWIRDAFYGLHPSFTIQMLELFLLASGLLFLLVPLSIPDEELSYWSLQRSTIFYEGTLAFFSQNSQWWISKDREWTAATSHYGPIWYLLSTSGHGERCWLSTVGNFSLRCTLKLKISSHMIASRTQYDVHALICVLEMVTIRLLACLKPDLHGLVIPSSWVFVLSQHGRWPSTRNLGDLTPLVESSMQLVRQITNGAGIYFPATMCYTNGTPGHLFVDGALIRDASGPKRTGLIRRM